MELSDKKIDELLNTIPAWKKAVFDHLGIIIYPGSGIKYDMLSACGAAYMDCPNISLSDPIEKIVSEIENMDVYKYQLKNIKIGRTHKADLFWAIYYKIINGNKYIGTEDHIFGLRAIDGPRPTAAVTLNSSGKKHRDESSYTDTQGEIWFDTSICGYDQYPLNYNLKQTDTLEALTNFVAKDFKVFLENWENPSVLTLSYEKDAEYKIPVTYEEIIRSYSMLQY